MGEIESVNRNDLTKEMRWKIADRIAEDLLPQINSMCRQVTPRNTFYVRHIKRMMDVIIAFLVLLLTFPVNLLIGIITYFDMGTPVFFIQERAGKNGKVFNLIKFRNMTNERDRNGELLAPVLRVTKFGKFVRKTSLDELLNFWSILKGDMSLIGPRPLPPEYVHRYSVRHYARLAVSPGLECPPREKLNHVWTWQEQFENDIWYVENVSFLTDCKMLLRLVQFAFDKKSASARADVKRGIFMGYDSNGIAINLEQVSEAYIEKICGNDK